MKLNYDFSLSKLYLNISLEPVEHLYAEYPATGLLDEARLREIMSLTGDLYRAYDLRLPASFLGTTLCHLCLTKLLFVAQYGRILELTLDRLSFQIDNEEGHGHPHLGYQIKELVAKDLPAENAEGALLEDWNRFVAHAVTPAVEAIAKVGGVKPEIVWQQFGGLTGSLLDLAERSPYPEALKASVRYHVNLIAEAIPAEAFRTRRNPFLPKLRYVENPSRPEEKWVMKSSCCLYDCRAGGEKCYTCPKMTPDERESRKERLLQTQA